MPLFLLNEGGALHVTQNTAHYITDYQGDLLDAILADLVELDNTGKLQIVQNVVCLLKQVHFLYGAAPSHDKLSGRSYLVVSAVSQVISALSLYR